MKKHLVQELTERCLICDQAVWVSGYENNRHHVGYDAKFCRACDTWLESTCPDPAANIVAGDQIVQVSYPTPMSSAHLATYTRPY